MIATSPGEATLPRLSAVPCAVDAIPFGQRSSLLTDRRAQNCLVFEYLSCGYLLERISVSVGTIFASME